MICVDLVMLVVVLFIDYVYLKSQQRHYSFCITLFIFGRRVLMWSCTEQTLRCHFSKWCNASLIRTYFFFAFLPLVSLNVLYSSLAETLYNAEWADRLMEDRLRTRPRVFLQALWRVLGPVDNHTALIQQYWHPLSKHCILEMRVKVGRRDTIQSLESIFTFAIKNKGSV